jgi:hypothetical protein
MKTLTQYLLLSSLVFGSLGTIAAQEKSEAKHMPPKMLNISREFTKPGKAGTVHEKSEAAFVKAMRDAKWPTHYLAVDSLSGKPRSLFFTAYDSFEAMEKDARATEKNEAFSAALERAEAADGELLSDTDTGDFVFHEEYSLRPAVDIPHMRYFDISVFRLRPGHEKDWDTLAKMYVAAYEKIPDGHWATYEAVYGQTNATYLVITPMKSASEIDHSFAEGKDFVAAMGEDGMKKLAELSAAAIESTQSNLFAFNPRMSYVSDDWVKADPDFWKPKPAHAAAAAPNKSEEKSEKKK